MAIGTATAILGGAALGVGGSILAADKQSSAVNSAASSQAQATLASTQMQLDFLRENRADIAEAVEAGLIDLEQGFNLAMQELQPLTGLEEYNQARALLADPSSLADRPSYQFQLEQGTEALQGAFSRGSGGGLSGRGVQAAQEFGQNLASTALDAELNRLFPFINTAVQARSNISQLQASQGSAKANLRLGGATGQANVSGQYAPGIAAGIQSQGNIAANQAILGANVQTGLMSNLANVGTQFMNTAAANPGLFSTPASTPQPYNPWVSAQNPLGLTPGQGL
jgi:hypothetical protein